MVNRLPLAGVGQINGLEFEGQPSDRAAAGDRYADCHAGLLPHDGHPADRRARTFTESGDHRRLGAVPVGIVDERIARQHLAG